MKGAIARLAARAARVSEALPLPVASIAALALPLAPLGAAAQDFAAPRPPAAAGPAEFLERGFPAAGATLSAEALVTRWYEVPGLTTRAIALSAAWRTLRAAAGISRTGDDDLGWSAAAFALGAAGPAAGGALRAALRRDGAPAALDGGIGPGAGLEAGGGAWVRAGSGLTLSASAPQLFTRGVAPPLERGLEIGASWIMDDLSLRLTRVSDRDGAGAAQHEAGLALSAGLLTVWLEARDLPTRGGLGLEARAGAVTIAGVVESHPVLGETVRMSLGLSRAARARRASAPPASDSPVTEPDPAPIAAPP